MHYASNVTPPSEHYANFVDKYSVYSNSTIIVMTRPSEIMNAAEWIDDLSVCFSLLLFICF